MKHKLLIVGAFKAAEKGVYGGIATSCETMMKSSITSRFIIKTIDSTQISNPKPHFIIRSTFALKRLVVFISYLIWARPDAVLLFTAIGASVVEKGTMGWICRLFGLPALIFPRGGEIIHQVERSKIALIYTRFFFKGSNVFLCQGSRWREFAIDKLLFDDSHVSLIPNWTATEEHLNIGKNRSFDIINQPINLFFLGWLEDFKGIFELLNVCKSLADQGVEFTLTVAGRGNAEKKAKDFVKQNNLDEFVIFAGWVKGDELTDLLTKNNIFVLPSWNEGLPNSMIEAMAAGLAVVVTSVGVIPDYVENREHAILIPPKNEKLLEEALKLLIFDPLLRRKLAENSHNLVKINFSLESAMQNLGDVIERAIINIELQKINKK